MAGNLNGRASTDVGSERFERMKRQLASDPKMLTLVVGLVELIADRTRSRRR
jgi:hypothetical protein